MKAKKISVTELRNNLSAILKLVQNGTPVIIQDHGKSIAEIVPMKDIKKNLEDYGLHHGNIPTALF
ncbi:MAG: type II toxin-antitoxin system Phd/YefM family antitoxin [Saprospiraceae bacterium]